jgi:hypothetical protein
MVYDRLEDTATLNGIACFMAARRSLSPGQFVGWAAGCASVHAAAVCYIVTGTNRSRNLIPVFRSSPSAG